MNRFLNRLFGTSGKPAPTMKRTAQLGCENLETREVPAIAVTQLGGVLTYTGNEAANQLSLQQINAQGSIRAISNEGFIQGANDGSAITKVVVNLGGGNDNFSWLSSANTYNPLTLEVKLGTGNDTADLDFGRTAGRSLYGDMNIEVRGEGQNDTVTANFGTLRMNRLNFVADMSDGVDNVNVQMNGPQLAGLAKFSLSGGNQNDTMTFKSIGNSTATGTALTVNMNGQNDNDTLDLSFDGVIRGDTRFVLGGDTGNDTITARVAARYVEPASPSVPPGSLYAEVTGHDGADKLGLHLTLEGSLGRLDLRDAVVNGGLDANGLDVDGDSLLFASYQVRKINMG